MGVYINMEMPTTCEECNFESFCDKWIEARKMCGAKATIRHPKCPLVPVPPHGRLGDLDATAELIMQYCPDDDGSCSKAGVDLRELLDEIESLPTIIPAEGIDIQKEFIQNWHEEDNE